MGQVFSEQEQTQMGMALHLTDLGGGDGWTMVSGTMFLNTGSNVQNK